MGWFYPAVLLGLVGSSMLCGEAHAQFVVTDPTSDPAAVENAASDTANAASDAITATKETQELEIITSKEADDIPPPDSDPVTATSTLQTQLVTSTPTEGDAEALYTANTTQATANATAGEGGEQARLAVSTNLDGAALEALDAFAAQSAKEDATDVTDIGTAPNEEAMLGVVADLEQQADVSTREAAQMEAMTVLAVTQTEIDKAKEAKSEEENHEETATLFDVTAAAQ